MDIPLGPLAEEAFDPPARQMERVVISALSNSPHRDRLLLHGAWALACHLGGLPRPTEGIDLLDPVCTPPDDVMAVLQAAIGPAPGGLILDWAAARIRTKAARRSSLHRVAVPTRLGRHQRTLGINVMEARRPAPEIELHPIPGDGYGSPSWVACCTAVDLAAEKTALMVTYGGDHTRLLDIFDLWLLATRIEFDRCALLDALTETFAGRDALQMLHRQDGYWEAAFDPGRMDCSVQERWAGLIASERLPPCPSTAGLALSEVARLLVPVLRALRDGLGVPATWHAKTGWTMAETSTTTAPIPLAAGRTDFWDQYPFAEDVEVSRGRSAWSGKLGSPA